MADYFTKLSFAFPLPEAQAREFVDYVTNLNSIESEEEAPPVPEGWPDPEDFLHMNDDWVGLEASVEPEALDAPEGQVPVWIRDDAGEVNIDLLIELLETAVERFDLQDPIGFEWTNDCSKARLNAFGGGAAVVGRDADGKVASRAMNTQQQVTDLTAKLAAPAGGPEVDEGPSP